MSAAPRVSSLTLREEDRASREAFRARIGVLLRPQDLDLVRDVLLDYNPGGRPSVRALSIADARELLPEFDGTETRRVVLRAGQWSTVRHALAWFAAGPPRPDRRLAATLHRWVRQRMEADAVVGPYLRRERELGAARHLRKLAIQRAEEDYRVRCQDTEERFRSAWRRR